MVYCTFRAHVWFIVTLLEKCSTMASFMLIADQVRATLPALVTRLPAQAAAVRLKGFESAVSELVQEAFLGLLGEERVRLAVEGREGSLLLVQAFTLAPGVRSINAELKDMEAYRGREEKKAQLPSDTEELYITWFENCNSFYGQFTSTGLSELKDFLALVSSHCSGREASPLYRGSESHRGEVCAVPDSAPGSRARWYRARMARDQGPGPVEVALLDVGGRQVVERRDVVALPPHLARRQEFGLACSLGQQGWREPARLQATMVDSVVEVRRVRRQGEAWVVQLTRNMGRKFKNRLIHELIDQEAGTGKAKLENGAVHELLERQNNKHNKVEEKGGRRSRGPESQEKEPVQEAPVRPLERGDLRNSLRERRAARDAMAKAPLAGRYKPSLLKPGLKAECRITWMYSPSHFYVSLSQSAAALERIMERLQSLAAAGLPETRGGRGGAVAARWTDGCWYRGQVGRGGGQGATLEVYFVDFGNTERVGREEVRGLPQELGVLEAQAVRCRLGVEPVQEGWGGALERYFSQEAWQLEVVGEAGAREWLVTLNGGEVEAALLRDGVARERRNRREESSEGSEAASDTARSVKVGTRKKGKQYCAGDFPGVAASSLVGRALTGTVTLCLSWREFWLRPDSALETAGVQEAGEAGRAVVSLEEGECCLALHQETWHRAAVLAKASPLLSLLLVDTGCSVELPLADLRSALDFSLYSLPPAAVRCRLDARMDGLAPLLQTTGLRLSVQVRSFAGNMFTVKLEREKTEKERRGRKGRKAREGGRQEVSVVHVEAVDVVWVVERGRQEELQVMMEELGAWLEEEEHLKALEEPSAGVRCCVRYSEDGQYYRAEVTEVGEGEVEVQYLDYGNTEVVPSAEVLELPEQCAALKPAAARVEVQGAALALDCEEGRGKLESALQESVSLQLEGGKGVFYVRGKRLELGRLLRVGGAVNMFQVAGSPRTEGVVTWWESEGGVWLVGQEVRPVLQQLMARLQTDAPGLAGVGRVREGDLVAAQYSVDCSWCRARVLGLAEGWASLLFLDYGNTEEVPVAKLKSLPGELRLHPGFATELVVEREGARCLARSELRALVGSQLTAELVRPREGGARLYLGSQTVCPPPALAPSGLATARLRPREMVLAVVTGEEQGAVLVQVVRAAARVAAEMARVGRQEESTEWPVGELLVEQDVRRLVSYGSGRFLAPDTQLEVATPHPLARCRPSLARLPTAGLLLLPQGPAKLYPLPDRLLLLTPAGPHLLLLSCSLHLTATFGQSRQDRDSRVGEPSMFNPKSCLVISLPSSASSWSPEQLCEARDGAVQEVLSGDQAVGQEAGAAEDVEPSLETLDEKVLGALTGKIALVEEDQKTEPESVESLLIGNIELLTPLLESWDDDGDDLMKQEVEQEGAEVLVRGPKELPCQNVALDTVLVVERIGQAGRLVAVCPATLALVVELVDGLPPPPAAEDGQWQVGQLVLCGRQRGEVLQVMGELLEVLLVDCGRTLLCHIEEVQGLPQELKELPPAALQVQGAGQEVRKGQEMRGLRLGLQGLEWGGEVA